MRNLFFLLIIILFACSESEKDENLVSNNSGTSAPSVSVYPKKITISSIPSDTADYGIFDPSLEYDSINSKLWLSYSAVGPSASFLNIDRVVSTRLAYSIDKGSSWRDYGLVNQVQNVDTTGAYVNEVSSLVYDSRDVGKPWKIFWFKYFILADNSRRYDYSWIGVKSAATVEGLVSATEERLFAGSMYSDTPSVIQLDTALHADLNKCITFTEPGVVASIDAIYVSLGCLYSSGTRQDIILLKFTGIHSNITNVGNWSYVGTLLESNNASIHGTYDRYTGSELVKNDDDYYLFITPGSDTPFSSHYNGCLIYQIPDIDNPSVIYKNILSVGLSRDDFYGACDYNSNISEAGIFYIYPSLDLATPSNSLFYIYASGKKLNKLYS